MPRLLVLDTSYALETILSRKLEESVFCRDLDGFFNHVWTVHPFATLVTSEAYAPKHGRPQIHELSPVHTFIEGKVGQFKILDRITSLNFLISQIYIFFYLTRLIKKERVNVIRASSPLYAGLFGWAISRWCKVPLVVRVGGNHDKIYKTTGKGIESRLFLHRRIEKLVERFVFRRADLVAGANQDNLDFALANGAHFQRSTLFRYGNLIDKRHFVEPSQRGNGQTLLQEIGVSSHGFVLYIGRLEIVKQPGDVVRVLAEIQSRGYSIKAVLSGDGSQRSALCELAKNLGVLNQIVFAGNRDQDWLARIIPLSIAVISPHTGRALSEAALGGVPIVAYDIDWQRELIQTGLTGELVPYRDFRGMADSLEKYLVYPEYGRAMGDAVRERAMKMMNPQVLNQHERDHYSAVIGRFNR